jgi:hypothetical protein
MYADDILLIAGSIVNLQKMIVIAEQCFADINLTFNRKKCVAMRIGHRCKVACEHLVMSKGEIPWNSEMRYLGISFGQASSFKLNLHSNKVKFFQGFNSIYAKLGSSNSVDTIVHLMKSNCLSALLYNLESINLSKTDINNLKFPIFRAFMKIFHTDDKESINWCQYYMHMLPIEFLLDARKLKYYRKMSKSDCYVMQHLYVNSVSILMNNLFRTYGVTENISHNKFLHILWSRFYANLENSSFQC